MHLFYLDESGNTGADLTSIVEPVHWLVAVGLSPDAAYLVEQDMMSIAQRFFGHRALDADFELHGAEIFGGRGDARTLQTVERITLYREILDVIGQRGGVLFVEGIDKAAHAARAARNGYPADHPYRLGFMFLVEQIDRWLTARQPQPSLLPDARGRELGLLVSDEQDEMERDLVSRLARWRRSGTDYGYGQRQVRYLLDTLHYVKSQDSWLVQLTDCVAFARNRYEKVQAKRQARMPIGAGDQTIEAMWQTLCRPHIVRDRIWP